MSRRVVGDDGTWSYVAGWDNPLQSYFWQVMNADGDEVNGSQLGMPGQEIATVEELAQSAPFVINEFQMQQLKRDKEDSPPRSNLQERLFRMFMMPRNEGE